jgi:hypothetical protein
MQTVLINSPARTIFYHTNKIVDASLVHGASVRFAKTSMSFKLLTLSLEDMESHLQKIECSESSMVLEFVDALFLEQARRD